MDELATRGRTGNCGTSCRDAHCRTADVVVQSSRTSINHSSQDHNRGVDLGLCGSDGGSSGRAARGRCSEVSWAQAASSCACARVRVQLHAQMCGYAYQGKLAPAWGRRSRRTSRCAARHPAATGRSSGWPPACAPMLGASAPVIAGRWSGCSRDWRPRHFGHTRPGRGSRVPDGQNTARCARNVFRLDGRCIS